MIILCKVDQFASRFSTAVYGGLDSPVEQSNIGNVFLCSASLLLLLLPLLLFSDFWVRMEISLALRKK